MPARALDRSAVVEAARQCFLELGVRNATVEEVARRAGVSRATVYRTVGGRPDLVREVMLDEALVLFTNVGLAMGVATSATQLIAGGVHAALATIRDRPVLRRFVRDDIDDVLPVLTVDAATLVAGTANLLEPMLISARDRGVISPSVEVRHLAEELIRYVLGLLHTPVLGADASVPQVGAERAARLFAAVLVGSDPMSIDISSPAIKASSTSAG